MTYKAREEFEAWHRSVVAGEPPHEKYNSGDYRDQHVQRYWLGWKSSRETLVIELPVFDDYPASIDAEMRESLRAVIESAGLKVKP